MRVAAFVAILAWCAACPRDPARPQPTPGSPGPGLVSADELRDFVPDASHVIVDLRPRAEYMAGHIPGAVHLDVTSLRAPVDGVPEQLAPREQVDAAFTAAGIDPDDEVVVLDHDAGPPAARMVWTLLYFGHPAPRVRLLDRGWEGWLASGGPQSTAPATITSLAITSPAVATRHAALGREHPASRVDAGWIREHLHDPAVLLLDVRSDDEWAAGRIPGATHLPWQRARDLDGRLLPPPALRERYAQALAAPTVVTYCSSGMRASVTWLVLRLLGHPDVRLYDGSWNEWSARPDLPREP